MIGALSILCGVAYTGGPYPLGYNGLGDIFVLVFFGPVAVSGTYYVHTLEWSLVAAVVGLSPGLLSMALLAVNNLRDIDEDTSTGKRTLAVRFGRTFAKLEYSFSVVAAFCIPGIYSVISANMMGLSFFLGLGIAYPQIRDAFRLSGTALNELLARTGKLLILLFVLFLFFWGR